MDGAGRPLWRNVWVMALTIVGTLTAMFSWNRIFWLMLRDRGATEAQVGWAAFFLLLAYRLPQVLGGLLADRRGRKAIVVLGTFGMAAAYLAVAEAPGWKLPVVALGSVWLIGALQWPSLVSLVADSVPEGHRGRAMGLLESGSMIGITLGPLLGEQVLGRAGLAGAVRILLLGSCGAYAACGVLRWILLREGVRHGAPGDEGAAFPWARLLAPAGVTVLMFMLFFLTTEGPILAFYIKDELGGRDELVQRVAFHGGLGSIAGALAAGWLSDRLGAGRVMALSAVLTGALSLLLAAGAVPTGLVPFLLAALFAPGEAFLVAYQKLITSVGPAARRGLAVGLVGTAVGLTSSWALVLGGTLYEEGHRRPFIAAAAAGALAVGASLVLCRGRFNARNA